MKVEATQSARDTWAEWRLGVGRPDLVSVIVTAYNQDWVLRRTLESVAAQTYRPIECVIVDDGSTDQTAEVIAKFAARHSADLEITSIRQSNGRAQRARNAGVTRSRGEYIQFLDGDDLLGADKIREQVSYLSSEVGNTCDLVYGNAKWLHDDGSKTWEGEALGIGATDDVLVTLLDFSRFNPPFSYLCRRAVVERCGGWDPSLMINDDVDYFLRMACAALEAGHCVSYVPVMTGFYRKHTRPRTSEGGMHLIVRFNTIILKLIEERMRDAGLLSQSVQRALAEAYYRVSGWASLIDDEIWFEDLQHCRRLEPTFVPATRHSAILQRLFGFMLAERLKRKIRRARYRAMAKSLL